MVVNFTELHTLTLAAHSHTLVALHVMFMSLQVLRVFEAPGNFIGNLSRIAKLKLKQVRTCTTLCVTVSCSIAVNPTQ